MDNIISYEYAKKEFERYLNSYDRTNGSINLKIIHTYEVVKKSEFIAHNLDLSDEDKNIAKIIALLHDIGRFEQIKNFGVFDDTKLDHGQYGIKVLFEDTYSIRKYVKTNIYDDIIYKAIYNHNKLEIESGLNDRELLHAQIIRDADKLDNFRVKEFDKIEDSFPGIFDKDKLKNEIISQKVYEDFLNHKCIKLSDRKTMLDYWFCVIAFIYDLNFNVSLNYVREKNYINKLIDRLDYFNIDTKNKVENLRKSALEYLEDYK